MSDNEDLLGDDLVLGDETYNFGNEEEDILLAGGNINDHIKSKQDLPIHKNVITEPTKKNDISHNAPSEVTNHVETNEKVEVQIPNKKEENAKVSENIAIGKAVDQRYRDNQKERFPTERSNANIANKHTIPDTLDTVVPGNSPNKNFNNRRNNRGRRQGKRGDFRNHENANFHHPVRNDFRQGGPPQPPSNMPQFKENPDFINPSNNHPPPFVKTNQNPNFRPNEQRFYKDFGPQGMRQTGNNRKIGMMPSDMGNVRPSNVRISVDFRSNPNSGQNFRNYAPGNFNPVNFNQNNDYRPPMVDVQEPFDNRGFPQGNNFQPDRYPNFDRPPNNLAPGVGHFNNGPVVPPNFRGVNHVEQNLMPVNEHNLKNMHPMLDSKKVLINPHFIGNGPNVLGNIDFGRDSAGNLYNTNVPNVQNQLHAELENRQMSEEELERRAEQFIDEQRRCLQRAKAAAENDDYYEKTQRFLESTAKDLSPDRQKKEYLKRKQEEFINENRLNLNRRRRVSPPRAPHRPSPPRHRISPYKRPPRPRSPPSPTQNKRELSGEPEEREYRAKLREQAEMRQRILQAKERRRRRDAANLNEKNQNNTDNNQTTQSSINNLPKRFIDDTPPVKQNQQSTNEVKPERKELVKIVEQQQQHQTDDKNVSVNEVKKDTEKPAPVEKRQETLEDILEDDLLRLFPEDEDLLLSDDDNLTFTTKSNDKIKILGSSNKSEVKDAPKAPKAPITFSSNDNNSGGVKRSNTNDNTDLRKKLTKTSEASTTQSSNSAPNKMKIVYSNTDKESTQKSIIDKKDNRNKDADNSNGNKWRSTFNEQKLDLTAPVAARAISAVMRGGAESNQRKVIPSKSTKSIVTNAQRDDEKNKTQNGGRQPTVAAAAASTGRRVVIPPRPQKPLVIIENDEDDSGEPSQSARRGKGGDKKTALVTGLPPGMTEVRLLSLCGPDVEQVNVGAGGTAEVNFSSGDACQRFVRRFHGRTVAACRLSVTTQI